ncbi:MAG: radical SAM protein [Methanomassiliicoccales archaeon]|nr:radical SAM protein [Methanomassiliicoccales archaeon]
MSRLMSVRQMAFYGGWLLRSKLGDKRPLVNTMIINYDCNLRCKHCAIVANLDNLPPPHKIPFAAAVEEMKEHFGKGCRILFFEGGEPTMWKDGDKDLRDLIKAGREIGYFVIGYTTNGTNVIYEESDVISVSLDGPREVHDEIRCAGAFDALMANLEKIKHPNVFANMVVMRQNLARVEETVRIAAANKRIRGIMLNFITPPPREIALTLEEKRGVVDLALRLKKEGLPILNTTKALREMLIEDYTELCPYWVSDFILPDRSHYHGCPAEKTAACKECGFDAVREYRLITKGSVSTIRQMSGRFAVSKQR